MARKLDGLLITSDVNIRYITSFPASESWLLVGANKKVYYLTDSRYTLEAKKGLKGVTVIQYKKSMYASLFALTQKLKIRRLGFDEHQFTVARFKLLKKQTPKTTRLMAANHLVEDLRMTKDRTEVQSIRDALKLHKKALAYLQKIIKPGITEYDVLMKLEHFVKKRGAGFSFDPIIASGPNSCLPHAHVSRRKIRNNEPVLIDMGIDINGYKSDLTRMFFLGKIAALITDVHKKVYEAQRQAMASIKPGVRACDVDYKARKYLAKNKLAKYFGHSLGHGVGLDIHEAPSLSPNNNTILKPGMIITVEPGVYLPDQFGIRIEDMVLVTENGYEILSDTID